MLLALNSNCAPHKFLSCTDFDISQLQVLQGCDHTRLLPLHDCWVEEQEVEAQLLFAEPKFESSGCFGCRYIARGLLFMPQNLEC
jgi:hypothetical protein